MIRGALLGDFEDLDDARARGAGMSIGPLERRTPSWERLTPRAALAAALG